MGIVNDFRFAIRTLVKDRWFAVLAVTALSLGIGVNNTVFTFVNAVLLRGLPYEKSDRIMHLSAQNLPEGREFVSLSYPDFEDWRAKTETFSGLAAYRGGTMNISGGERLPERAVGNWISADTFRLIGQRPLIGRDFANGEDREAAEPVAIVGYGLWMSRYGGDPDLVGQVIRVNEVPTTVVGVMPEGVRFPMNSELWLPLTGGEHRTDRGHRNLQAFGRLAEGRSLQEARAEMSGIAAQLAEEYPDTNGGVDAVIVPYNDRYNGGEIQMIFLALMVAVGFVLLIACANVANLLLARAAYRAREIAVRTAVGASRWQIVRQLLVESLLLGLLAGGMGFVLSLVGVRLFANAVADIGKPYWIEFTMDLPVFAFLLVVTVATGFVFGLAPALQTSKLDVNETLHASGRGGGAGVRARRFTRAMVVVQLALTVVLLFGGALMVRSFLNLYNVDLGIHTQDVLRLRLGLAERKYPRPEDRVAFHERLRERLSGIPGLQNAALASHLPLGGGLRRELLLEGQEVFVASDADDARRAPRVTLVIVSPEYFETLGVPVSRGRGFRAMDGEAGAEAAILNERAVDSFFGADDPIGTRLRLLSVGRDSEADSSWIPIVGIVPSIRQRNMQSFEDDPVVYLPYRQEPNAFVNLLVRSRREPTSLSNEVRSALRDVDPDQPVYLVQTIEEALAAQRWPMLVFGSLFVIFALIALVIAGVGVYAVMAYAVSQRTQEFGMRMVLGATAQRVSWLVLRGGAIELGIGLGVGLIGALLAGRVLSAVLIRVTPSDPIALAAISLLLIGVTAIACLVPARRACFVSPVEALRSS